VLQLIKNNNPFTVIILLILTLLLKLSVILHPHLPADLADFYLYNLLLHILNAVLHNSAFAYTILGVTMVFMQALYINRIAARHKLFSRPTYIPAFVYLLLTSLFPPWNYFNVTLIIIWCILGGVDVLLGFTQPNQARKKIFNAGFFFCLGAMFQFSVMAYLVLLIMGIFMLRSFNLGEWVVAFMGYFTPVYFFAGILFLADKLFLLPRWVHISTSVPVHITAPFYFTVLILGLITLVVCGLYAMQLQLPKSSIYIRRNWAALLIYVIISVVIGVGTGKMVQSGWLIIVPSLCFVISMALLLEKNKGFSNFIFYFSLILVVVCQLTIN
jgi:hypothetical protein